MQLYVILNLLTANRGPHVISKWRQPASRESERNFRLFNKYANV